MVYAQFVTKIPDYTCSKKFPDSPTLNSSIPCSLPTIMKGVFKKIINSPTYCGTCNYNEFKVYFGFIII